MKHRQLQPFRTAPTAAMAQFNEGQSEFDNCIFSSVDEIRVEIFQEFATSIKMDDVTAADFIASVSKMPSG